MGNPQFGETEDRFDYKDGRPSDIVRRKFRKSVEVRREHWQEETVVAADRSQITAVILASTEKVYSGEWLDCQFEITPHKSGGMFMKTRYKIVQQEGNIK